MDLNQLKLTKNEWENTEIPVSANEMEILKLIVAGYHNVNHVYNTNTSLLNFLKLEPKDIIFEETYKQYFKADIDRLQIKYNIDLQELNEPIKLQKLTSIEKLKLENLSKTLNNVGMKIFEYFLLYNCELILKSQAKGKIDKVNKIYYTIYHLLNLRITNINPKVKKFTEHILSMFANNISLESLIKQSKDLIERNNELNSYRDIHLYEHQKRLFTIIKNPNPKLVLYIAPTGMGKTISPIGLSENNKVIFVCAARHVGLALAKAAISVGRKIAFAFGCKDPTDIRLNNFAAASYIKHELRDEDDKRSCICRNPKCIKQGQDIKYKDGSKRVDHSDGSNVQIMICDIKSYISAMNYMIAFNKDEDGATRYDNMILYWDEPTITMDYEEHECHKFIKENWNSNVIPNIVLSSATLPKENEIIETIGDFRSKFENSYVHSIVSHDCNKSIPILDENNFVQLPHLTYSDYNEFKICVDHCNNYTTLLRYFDLEKVTEFILYANRELNIANELKMEIAFENLVDLNMNNLKMNYLKILNNLTEEEWNLIKEADLFNYKPRYTSCVHFGTKDAHTLVDGPTIFLANDVEKIGKFILQSNKIPQQVLTDMIAVLEHNNSIIEMLTKKQKNFEDSLGSEIEKDHKMSSDVRLTDEQRNLKREIDNLEHMVKTISLSEVFVPNKLSHLRKWTLKENVTNEFTSDVTQQEVEKILLLDVENNWKILLLMGIGVFTTHKNNDYIEIMKQLASNQKLFMIIASSDYIYGTNYQFCHGYIGKDLQEMSQEKAIQAMGRIGRNQIDKDYSIRFRFDGLIHKILKPEEDKIEVRNMNNLFNSDL
jgi:hypothetical protein